MIDAEYVGTRRREQMAARKLEDAARAMHDAADILSGLDSSGLDCPARAAELRVAADYAAETAMRIR